MAKKPLSGRCVYCLDNFDEGTRDHVLPRAWYPDTTPQNLEKWKVPCHEECNNKYSQLERNLLISLGLCVDPKEAKVSGIADKALRSIDPEQAKNERDKRARQNSREKIKKEISKLDSIPMNGVLPNFGPKSNATYPPHLAITIQSDKLKAFACKLVRGMHYVINKSFIEENDKIEIFFAKDNSEVKNVNQKISRYGQTHSIEPGITVGHVFSEDKHIALYVIDIWNKLKIHASVEKR